MVEDAQRSGADSSARPPTQPGGPPSASKNRASAIGVAVGGAALVAALYSGVFACPVARYAKMPCPACGSTRAIWAVLHGDLHEVLRMNPVAPIAVVLLAIVGARAVHATWTTGSARAATEGRVGNALTTALVWVVGVQILVWALRMFGLLGGPVPV